MKKLSRKPKDITNARPLVDETEGLDNPRFMEDLEEGKFLKPDTKFKNRFGQPVKWRNDFMRQVYYLARLGARDVDIAEFFGVNDATVDEWKRENADFREAWTEGHWMFGMKVGETLGNRALGYDYKETEYSQHVDRNGEIHDLVKVTHKHMAPDTVAIIFFLKNRFRDSWADVNRTEVEARVQVDVAKKLQDNLEHLTPEERSLVKSIAVKNISTIQGVSNN
jgi:hypothetical protein